MNSFRFGSLSPKDRASGRFLAHFHRAIASAALMQKKALKINQRSVAAAMDVDKSVVSRILSGHGNPTLRTVAELAWAMGLRPSITFERIDALSHNDPAAPVAGQMSVASAKSALEPRRTTNSAKVEVSAETVVHPKAVRSQNKILEVA